MPIVTAIKPQKNKKRVNIYLDDKFGFGLDLETFVKSGIKVEKELTESEIEKIIKEGEFQKIYQNILRFASLRPRSEKEFRDWLKRKKVHESIIPELLGKLVHLDLIDDEKFARWWIDSRLTFKSKGPVALKMELQQKGIDRNVAKKLIEELVSENTQIGMAKKLLENKKNKWENLEGFEKRKKITEIVLSKGFGWDIVRKLTSIDD
jgi:regulatory protein